MLLLEASQEIELVLSPDLTSLLFHSVRFLCFNLVFIILLRVL